MTISMDKMKMTKDEIVNASKKWEDIKQKEYARRKWLPFPKTQEEVHLIANMTQFIAADDERTKFVCGVFDCGSPVFWPHKKPKNWVPKYWIPFPRPGIIGW